MHDVTDKGPRNGAAGEPLTPAEIEAIAKHQPEDLATVIRLARARCEQLDGSEWEFVPNWARPWWQRQKRQDEALEETSGRAAAAREKEAKDRKARERALAKLTPEERAALGIWQ